MSDKVAVLVATYNGRPYIESQLISILGQTHNNFDILLRDDGSSDGTLDLVQKRFRDQVTIIIDGISTGSAAGNFFRLISALPTVGYDYVAFADQDDIWFPDKLERALSMIESSQAAAYSSDLIAFDNQSQTAWHLKKHSSQKRFDYLFQGASAGCTYLLSNEALICIKRSMGDAILSLPAGHSHDWLIYAICRSYGLKWFHDDVASISYRQHSVNAFGAMPGLGGLLKRLSFARSGWYREQILWQRQFLSGTNEEAQILDAVQRFDFSDRLYLLNNVMSFRRSLRDCILISLLIVFGKL